MILSMFLGVSWGCATTAVIEKIVAKQQIANFFIGTIF